MNNFFVLRDMNILSKNKMFKIEYHFDSKHFEVRALHFMNFFQSFAKISILYAFFGRSDDCNENNILNVSVLLSDTYIHPNQKMLKC